MPDELWTEVHDNVQETGIKTIPMEKKCKKVKWLSGEALQKEPAQAWPPFLPEPVLSFSSHILSPWGWKAGQGDQRVPAHRV